MKIRQIVLAMTLALTAATSVAAPPVPNVVISNTPLPVTVDNSTANPVPVTVRNTDDPVNVNPIQPETTIAEVSSQTTVTQQYFASTGFGGAAARESTALGSDLGFGRDVVLTGVFLQGFTEANANEPGPLNRYCMISALVKMYTPEPPSTSFYYRKLAQLAVLPVSNESANQSAYFPLPYIRVPDGNGLYVEVYNAMIDTNCVASYVWQYVIVD